MHGAFALSAQSELVLRLVKHSSSMDLNPSTLFAEFSNGGGGIDFLGFGNMNKKLKMHMNRAEVARLLTLLGGPMAETVSLRQLKAAFTEHRLQAVLTEDDAVSMELFTSLDHHLTETGLRLPDLWAQVHPPSLSTASLSLSLSVCLQLTTRPVCGSDRRRPERRS